jgi:hypothetical protein
MCARCPSRPSRYPLAIPSLPPLAEHPVAPAVTGRSPVSFGRKGFKSLSSSVSPVAAPVLSERV